MAKRSKKHFQHRDKWFWVSKSKAPNWTGSGYAVHVSPTLKKGVDPHHFYIEEDDALYKISAADLLSNRAIYNGRYHIDRYFLTPIEIDDEWRYEIDMYNQKRRKV